MIDSAENVLILLVTHQGEDTVRDTLHSCRPEGEEGAGPPILVIDNASTDETAREIESLSIPGLHLLRLERNKGVAGAYNDGIEYARQRGKSWIFILDQDTICRPGCLNRLYRTARDLTKKGMAVGAVCPTAGSRIVPGVIHFPCLWNGRGFAPLLRDGTPGKAGPMAVDSSITSGTLYRRDALEAIEGFREEYFIDFVDHECHLRLRRAGWSMFWEREAEILHRLGRIQRMTEDGLWIEHEPFRYYYMARNMLEGHWRLGGWRAAVHVCVEIFKHARRLRNLGEEPGKSLRFILEGVKDALLGRSGPRNPPD